MKRAVTSAEWRVRSAPQFDFRHRQASCARPRAPLPLRNSECACRLGLRWQAQRDTAFARTEAFSDSSPATCARKRRRRYRSAGAVQNRPSQNECRKRVFKCGMESAECELTREKHFARSPQSSRRKSFPSPPSRPSRDLLNGKSAASDFHHRQASCASPCEIMPAVKASHCLRRISQGEPRGPPAFIRFHVISARQV